MAAPTCQAGTASLVDIVDQLAAELRLLGKTLGEVERAVEFLIAASKQPDLRAIHGLQTIDLLGQSLLALATFTAELSPQIPRHWQLDVEHATRSVTLSAIAERLRFATTSASQDIASADLEMFE